MCNRGFSRGSVSCSLLRQKGRYLHFNHSSLMALPTEPLTAPFVKIMKLDTTVSFHVYDFAMTCQIPFGKMDNFLGLGKIDIF